jgi:hypothetical protein
MDPIYSGPNRTGVCQCGHSWEKHHLCLVAPKEYVDATGEGYLPCECEYYGCNESGGLDADGNSHCHAYRDEGLKNEQLP